MADGFRFENNLWYAWDNPVQSAPSLPGTENGSIVGVDPMFSSEYRLSPLSPAAGAGVRLGDVSGDFDGFCYLDPPSIGAHEVRQ